MTPRLSERISGGRFAVTGALVLLLAASECRAGFIVDSFVAGPNGGAEVDGFPPDNKNAYTSILDAVVTDGVDGMSGDADDSAVYRAQQSYFVPSAGSSLTTSGAWHADTFLTTKEADFGAGLLFNAYLNLVAGQSYSLTGTMKNAGIVLRDPDNQDVFPYLNNYFTNTTDVVSLSGTLTKSGIYVLDMTSSIYGGAPAGFDLHYDGTYNLTFTVGEPAAVPLPSSIALMLTGLPSSCGLYFWRRRKKTLKTPV